MDDMDARVVARACGPVDLDPSEPGFIGATRLTNNTAESQALAEGLRWILRSQPPASCAILVRTDSTVVIHWAMNTTQCQDASNQEVVACLRYLWKEVASRWTLRWSHVKGHSGHRWNVEADRLATAGMEGEAQGFSAGEPLDPTPEPVKICEAHKSRYIWLVSRQVAVSTCQQQGKVVVESCLANCSAPSVIYVPAGQYLPLEQSPSAEKCLSDLIGACSSAPPAQRIICHIRPQAFVFDAGDFEDAQEARDWLEESLYIGHFIEELSVPAGLGYWQLRCQCAKVSRGICREDVLDITGHRPPSIVPPTQLAPPELAAQLAPHAPPLLPVSAPSVSPVHSVPPAPHTPSTLHMLQGSLVRPSLVAPSAPTVQPAQSIPSAASPVPAVPPVSPESAELAAPALHQQHRASTPTSLQSDTLPAPPASPAPPLPAESPAPPILPASHLTPVPPTSHLPPTPLASVVPEARPALSALSTPSSSSVLPVPPPLDAPAQQFASAAPSHCNIFAGWGRDGKEVYRVVSAAPLGAIRPTPRHQVPQPPPRSARSLDLAHRPTFAPGYGPHDPGVSSSHAPTEGTADPTSHTGWLHRISVGLRAITALVRPLRLPYASDLEDLWRRLYPPD